MTEAQKNINKINARIQYAEKLFGKNSDFVNHLIEGLYTGKTKEYIHKTKTGGIRLSKSLAAAEAFGGLINQTLKMPTAGQAMKWFSGSNAEKVEKINLYSKAKEELNDMLAELYGYSKKGMLPTRLEKMLNKGSIERDKEEIIKAYKEAKKLLGR